MTENTTENTETPAKPVVTKAPTTWKDTLAKSEAVRVKGVKFTKDAGHLLWTGAQEAINSWLPDADIDVSGETLYTEVMDALGGKHRKGDASKIKTVALAVKENGLVLAVYPNLSKAYAEAVRLTKTTQQNADDDAAADKATEDIAKRASATASTPEDAALIVLAKGVDEAAKLLLDALGANNDAAHRALLRAISNEIAGRVKPKVSTVKAGPKDGATQAGTAAFGQSTKPKAAVQTATKAKPVAAGTKAAPVKAAPAKAAQPVKTAQPVKRAAPVVKGRPAVKRG